VGTIQLFEVEARADQELQLMVGTDAKGGCCWEVPIDGVLHQDRSPTQLRALIEQRRAQQPHNPSAQWAQLEPVEGLAEDADAGRPGWGGMIEDKGGWREEG
jgi:hypothetical protein